MASDTTRESLLDAAHRVMQRDGAGNLTLDGVAREAGVSKGGLLYHFPSKNDLLRAVVRHGMEETEAAWERALGPDPARGAFARQFLREAVRGKEGERKCPPQREMVWSMLGAAANDPTLMQPANEMHARLQRRLESEVGDPDVAMIFHLVGHGIWSAELFGCVGPDEAQRERIAEKLCRMAGFDNMEEN